LVTEWLDIQSLNPTDRRKFGEPIEGHSKALQKRIPSGTTGKGRRKEAVGICYPAFRKAEKQNTSMVVNWKDKFCLKMVW